MKIKIFFKEKLNNQCLCWIQEKKKFLSLMKSKTNYKYKYKIKMK